MRYEDWDVILFPVGRDAVIPFKEFKVACHVVPDFELSHIHGAVGMPIMTCFVPSLPPGSPFQISLHCWRIPEISQTTRAYSKHTELVKFEARVMLDGRLAATTIFDREVNGPHLVTHTFELTKTGELERLRFPLFRRELLYQNFWHPGDDVGRIKVIISEGFPRDSVSVPVERVRNVVAFSFQHAPLEILESSGIAWPNPSMWNGPSVNPAMQVPTYQLEAGAGSHTHSPRRGPWLSQTVKSQRFPAPFMAGGGFQSQARTSFSGNPTFQPQYYDWCNPGPLTPLPPHDLFNDPEAYLERAVSMTGSGTTKSGEGKISWPASSYKMRDQSSTDTSMPDYNSLHGQEAMQISGSSLEEDPMTLRVPTNTPTVAAEHGLLSTQGTEFQLLSESTALSPGLDSPLTQSLLNQPLGVPFPPHHFSFSLPGSKGRTVSSNVIGPVPNVDMSKFSQYRLGLGKPSLSPVRPTRVGASEHRQSDSPTPQATFHDRLGNILANPRDSAITNTTYPNALSRSEAVPVATPDKACSQGDGESSRTRTPASGGVMEGKDEPRRSTPQ